MQTGLLFFIISACTMPSECAIIVPSQVPDIVYISAFKHFIQSNIKSNNVYFLSIYDPNHKKIGNIFHSPSASLLSQCKHEYLDVFDINDAEEFVEYISPPYPGDLRLGITRLQHKITKNRGIIVHMEQIRTGVPKQKGFEIWVGTSNSFNSRVDGPVYSVTLHGGKWVVKETRSGLSVPGVIVG